MKDDKFNLAAGAKWLIALAAAELAKVPMAIQLLTAFLMLDYASGVAAAYVRKEWCSEVGGRGLVKKFVLIPVLLAAIALVERFIRESTGENVNLHLMDAAALGCCTNEAISIVENCAKSGLPIPASLVSALLSVKRMKVQQQATAEELRELADQPARQP